MRGTGNGQRVGTEEGERRARGLVVFDGALAMPRLKMLKLQRIQSAKAIFFMHYVSHFPYTHAHQSVCRNYREKVKQDRVQSQRPRRGFPSAQAIFFCPVFPCLAFSLHIRTSIDVEPSEGKSEERSKVAPVSESSAE